MSRPGQIQLREEPLPMEARPVPVLVLTSVLVLARRLPGKGTEGVGKGGMAGDGYIE